MRLHIFQHEAGCGPGAIAHWLALREIEAHFTRFHLGDPLPRLEDVDALLVLGGSMNAYQDADFPHLKPLRAFTGAALGANKRVLGVCLGAQIMADALGSRVVRAAHIERGWIEIARSEEAVTSPLLRFLPARGEFVSWHGDTFATPKGAVCGASSEGCAAQAFSWGERALALQFHPEADVPVVSGWIGDEPEADRAALRAQFLADESRFERQKLRLFAALDAWIES